MGNSTYGVQNSVKMQAWMSEELNQLLYSINSAISDSETKMPTAKMKVWCQDFYSYIWIYTLWCCTSDIPEGAVYPFSCFVSLVCVYVKGKDTITILRHLQIGSEPPEFQILRHFKWLYQVFLLWSKEPVGETMNVL